MIIDRLENLYKYVPEKYINGISSFIQMINEDMEEKTYEIYGTHVFAKVMSYATKPCEICNIEAHDKYIDIQATILGAEGIDIFRREELTEDVPYNAIDDVVFFEKKGKRPYAKNSNIPGYFSMIFPAEAHRPQEQVEGYDSFVKKLVIKLEVENE